MRNIETKTLPEYYFLLILLKFSYRLIEQIL